MSEPEADDEDDSVTSPLGPGEVLAGKYRIDRVLGKGGMGVVVAATHLELEDKVAVKFLLPQALKNQEAVARFVREARAAVRIKNEHVARIIDVGKLDTGAPYMVMEYLDGMDLGKLRSQGPVSIEDACEYVIQACDAMTDAHAIGIIHRDLKPANLFLTRRTDGAPVIKVLDFGISKVVDPNAMDASLTRTSMTMGSPRYMSPEQLRSAKEVDPRTDVWALGVILYELLSGSTPFRGNTYPELCASILGEPPTPSLRERRPEVPPELEAVMLRCVEKSVDSRFDSVSELAAALLPFAPASARARVERMQRVSGRPGMASTPSLPATDVDVSFATGKTTAAPWSGPRATEATPPTRARSGLWMGLGMAAIVVIGTGVYLGTRPSPSPVAPSANLDPVTRSLDTPLPAALTDPSPSAPSASVTPAPAPTPSASVAPVATLVRDPKRKASTEKPKSTPPPATTTPPPKKNPLDIGLK